MKIIKKIIEYGLYLLVFLLPWQTRWIIQAGEINEGYSEYLRISLYGTDVLLIILLLLFLFYKLQITNYPARVLLSGAGKSQINSKHQIPNYFWIICILELFIFISIFFADGKILALYKYSVFLLGAGLFWLVISADYNRIKLIWGFLAGIFLQACLGIWQFLTQSDFACKWLGIAMHNQAELGVSVIEIIGSDGIGQRWLRAYGGLDHPNILGGVLVVGILLLIGLLIEYSGFKNRKLDIGYEIGRASCRERV